ncbi:hypothetical protein RDV64_17060 [Acuticoccus sp. MNP-M23]|uniref:hypothetical protein n=1 Tax=Acuticoccus sp. MNP-M23 TaxID=3072793 RepID=UPI0028164803|nr:hypothetical protein [Acuticoccus sp. MNP-M23]WMS41764.1 hypothetical protein RDV64_17060 [Acuticoccus sp. MNP-M23]
MRSLIVAAFTLLALPAAAFEPTGNVVADAFLRTLDGLAFDNAAAGTVERQGTATVLDNVSGGSETKALKIDRVTIEGGTVNADNALAASAITYNGLAIFNADGKQTGSVGSVALGDVTLAPERDDAAVTDLLGDYGTLSVRDITATSAKDETLTIERVDVARTGRDKPGLAAVTLVMDGLKFDLSLFGEPTESQIRGLGYEALTLYIKAAGAWSAETGRMVIEPSAISVADMGTLTLEGSANGLTEQAFNAMESATGDFARLLEQMGSITVDGLTISFTDNGLTDRLLNAVGETSGADRATLIAQVTAALEAPVAALGDQGFTTEVTGALSRFLTEPGTLTVTSAPAQEVSALQVISAAMLNPEMIPGLLSLTVSAD